MGSIEQLQSRVKLQMKERKCSISKIIKHIQQYDVYMNENLGSGAYGKVFAGMNNSTSEKLAIKMIAREKGNIVTIRENELMCNLKREATILSKINSKSVVGFRDLIASKRFYYIIQQLCDCSLESLLYKHDKKYSQAEATQLMTQFLNGYYALISLNLVHCDLKPDNLLIKNGQLKIADFGLSRRVIGDGLLNRNCGTCRYQSPQVYKGLPYTSKCDVYSFGCIFYEILYRRKIFSVPEDKIYERMRQIEEEMQFPTYPEVSLQTQDFIRSCLRMHEIDRLSWLEIYNHPMFQGKVPNLRKLDLVTKSILSVIRKQMDNKNANNKKFLQRIGLSKGKQIGQQQYLHLLFTLPSISRQVTKQEIKYSFNYFDRDKNGKISYQQFISTLQKHGIQLALQSQLQFSIIKKVLVDGASTDDMTQTFTAEELMNVHKNQKAHHKFMDQVIKKFYKKGEIQGKFRQQKQDQKGLDLQAFIHLIRHRLELDLTEEECKAVFQKFDDNKDNVINLEEFKLHVSNYLRSEPCHRSYSLLPTELEL